MDLLEIVISLFGIGIFALNLLMARDTHLAWKETRELVYRQEEVLANMENMTARMHVALECMRAILLDKVSKG